MATKKTRVKKKKKKKTAKKPDPGSTANDVLAFVSKRAFHSDLHARPGRVVKLNEYVCSNRRLEVLRGGGRVFLVSVAAINSWCKENLWLVAVLNNHSFDGKRWVSKTNAVPVTEITSLLRKIKLGSGKGIKSKRDKLRLVMSQHPRLLSPSDVELLLAAAGISPANRMPARKAATAERGSRARWRIQRQGGHIRTARFSAVCAGSEPEELDYIRSVSASLENSRHVHDLDLELSCKEGALNPFLIMPANFTAVVEELVTRPWPELRTLRLGSPRKVVHGLGRRYMMEWVCDDDPVSYLPPSLVRRLCKATPRLRSMTVAGHTIVSELAHATLVELDLVGCSPITNLGTKAWKAARGLRLPKLQRLKVSEVEAERGGGVQGAVFFEFSQRRTPSLRQLDLTGSEIESYCDDAKIGIMDVVAESDILPQLEILSLPELGLCWDIDRMAVLREYRPRFAHLQRFVIKELDPGLDRREIGRLFPNVVIKKVSKKR